MAWLARSIANTLLPPEEESDRADPGPSASPGSSPPRGVREDLSELTGALANRFQGLASFLATTAQDGAPRRPDPAEIAGRFRAGLARLPGRQAVADLAKIASSLLPPELDDAEAAAGVTEEVVAFARDAALRPELWLDFPLPDDADSDDFDLSDAQQDHALAVESLAPELADLRIELCPSHMSEGCFWMIYFVLLHPRLKREDAEILSTPQILEAREKLSNDLQYQTKLQSSKQSTVPVPFSNEDASLSCPVELLGVSKDIDDSVVARSFSNIDYGIPQPTSQEVLLTSTVSDAISSDNNSSCVPVQLVPVLKDNQEVLQSRMEKIVCDLSTKDAVAEDQPVLMSEIALMDTPKDRQQRQPSADVNEQSRVVIQKTDNYDDDDDDGDEWLEEEETGGTRSTTIPIADDEDVSFSDLEEDDDAA
ncbi:hypothetical protein EJB05_27305 [Eragrostis curvula]|uniref:BSD domain-containing protein n=1 Tax=Eragrostis curvula TaxID=38414 RepID=A0A5J9UN25_9POAL|nr:hypothetical protein EJB05_27305 [Eragrostis curvula]